MLTWSEAQRRRISRWKDQFGCLPRLWESLQGKLRVGRVLRLGIGFRWGSTSDSLTCIALPRLLNRLLPSVLSQESRLKSPLQMLKSTFLINWLSVAEFCWLLFMILVDLRDIELYCELIRWVCCGGLPRFHYSERPLNQFTFGIMGQLNSI